MAKPPIITVKALSVKQPWAWLIVSGPKDVENRNWLTSFRGFAFIHAAKGIDFEAIKKLRARGINLPETFQTSGIVGSAEVSDCVPGYRSNSIWADREEWSFILKNRQPCQFVACYGSCKFFPLRPDIVEKILATGVKITAPGMTTKQREAIAMEFYKR